MTGRRLPGPFPAVGGGGLSAGRRAAAGGSLRARTGRPGNGRQRRGGCGPRKRRRWEQRAMKGFHLKRLFGEERAGGGRAGGGRPFLPRRLRAWKAACEEAAALASPGGRDLGRIAGAGPDSRPTL